jgi:hypothetical protein
VFFKYICSCTDSRPAACKTCISIVFRKKNLRSESIDAKQQYVYGRDTMTNAKKKQYYVKDEKSHLISCSTLQLIECRISFKSSEEHHSILNNHVHEEHISWQSGLQSISNGYDHMLYISLYIFLAHFFI